MSSNQQIAEKHCGGCSEGVPLDGRWHVMGQDKVPCIKTAILRALEEKDAQQPPNREGNYALDKPRRNS